MTESTPSRRDISTGWRRLLGPALAVFLPLAGCGGGDDGPPPVETRVWHVSPNGNGADCPTAQACLDRSAAGDTIEFAAGTYDAVGDTLVGDFPGGPVTAVLVVRHSLVLVAGTGADVRIDGHFVPGRIGVAITGTGSDVTIHGLGFDTGSPGLRVAGGSVQVENCRFSLGEHGIVADDATLDIRGCTFDEFAGEALLLRNCAGTIAGAELFGNNAGAYLAQSRDLRIENMLVAISCLSGIRIEEGGSVMLSGVTVTGSGMVPDDSCAIVIAGGAHATIDKAVIAFNRGFGIDCRNGGSASITCSDLFGQSAGNFFGCAEPTGLAGNIAVDPLFCDKPGLDFHLMPESPARADCGVMGAYGGAACEPPAPAIVRGGGLRKRSPRRVRGGFAPGSGIRRRRRTARD